MVGAVSPIGFGVSPAAIAVFQRVGNAPRGASEAEGGIAPASADIGAVAPTNAKDSTKSAAQVNSGQAAKSSSGANPLGLTEEQQAEVADLKKRDQEVRQHEAAHASVGGQYAGSPSYSYTTGPDGKRYATGGEVSIDTAPVDGNPAATIQKLQTVIAAALAPAEPSGQDRAVAAQARAAISKAQVELAQSRNPAGNDQAKSEGQDVGQGANAPVAANANATGQSQGTGQAESEDARGRASGIIGFDDRRSRATDAYRGAASRSAATGNAVTSLIGGLIA